MNNLKEKYELQLLQIKEQLQSIQLKVEKRESESKNINWGHFGDLGLVLERLQQINQFLK